MEAYDAGYDNGAYDFDHMLEFVKLVRHPRFYARTVSLYAVIGHRIRRRALGRVDYNIPCRTGRWGDFMDIIRVDGAFVAMRPSMGAAHSRRHTRPYDGMKVGVRLHEFAGHPGLRHFRMRSTSRRPAEVLAEGRR